MTKEEIEKAEAFLHAQGTYQSEVPLFRVKELLAQFFTEQTLSLKAEHAIEKLKIYQECNEAQCKLLKTISEFKNKSND